MLDWRQKTRVRPEQLRQRSRIPLVVLGIAVGDERQLPCVGHPNLVPTSLQQFAGPPGMRPDLHRDAHGSFATEAFQERFWRGHHPFLRHNRSLLIDYAHAALLVAQIDSHISAGFPSRLVDMLAHELVSLIWHPSGVRFST